MKVPVLVHRDGVFEEVRYAHFMYELGLCEEPIPMKILSVGVCNYSCPWCKRGGYRKAGNIIQGSQQTTLREIARKAKQHIERGYTIRFSGGDPCCYPGVIKALAKNIKKAGGTVSIAHNGSSPEFVQQLLEYTDFWAVDLKSMEPERFKVLTGTGEKGKMYLENTLRSIQLISWYNIPLEVRTVIFYDTSDEELKEIAKFLTSCNNGNLFWTLRLYDGKPTRRFKIPEFENVLQKARKIKQAYPGLNVGIRTKWETEKGLLVIKN